ncbi:MAG: hypothetical protein IJY93_07655 [Clostridia bacterium]|nr:hypothetical protein [Clostridia bacterium]
MSDAEVGVGTFIGFLKEKKSMWLIVIVLAVGIGLMLFGRDGTVHIGADDTEVRVRELCEQIDGVFNVHVMIRFEDDTVKGIAVVCDGGDRAEVKLKLTEVLCSLFSIPSGSVSVVGGK